MFCNPKFCAYPLRPNIKTLLKLRDWISCNSQSPLTHLKCCKQLHFYQITSFGIYCKLMLLFSKTYTVNDSTSRAFHFFHCFEKLPCMYALLCIFSDAQDEMRWSANFLYLCIFDKNPTECTYSGNTVLKRDWIILVAALSGTTLE